MSITSLQQKLLSSVNEYAKLLDTLTEEKFQRVPPGGGWCYAEVYSHIFKANLASLVAVDKCMNGTAVESNKRIHWLAWAILFLGKFPKGRHKAPESIAAMAGKISKEEARNLIYKFKNRLLELSPRIKKASLTQKIRHPRLGLLNARQWFSFIELHTRHHVKQLQRINRILSR